MSLGIYFVQRGLIIGILSYEDDLLIIITNVFTIADDKEAT